MKFALMQPYFFPYLGYFDLISRVDQFIVFDEAQHMRRGWINRNRILHPEKGWQYINVPLRKAPIKSKIKEIEIQDDAPWRSKLLNKLLHYRKEAPHFTQVLELLESCLSVGEKGVSELNTAILKKISDYLGISSNFTMLSELQVDLTDVHSPTDWVIRTARATNANGYVNLPGGRDLYPRELFKKNGLSLEFVDSKLQRYECGTYEFIEGLSIIDVLMWNGRRGTSNLMFNCATA